MEPSFSGAYKDLSGETKAITQLRQPHGPRGVIAKMMRVAIVMPLAVQRGGAETLLLNLLTQTAQANDQVTFEVAFLEEGPMVGDLQALGLACHVIASGHLGNATLFVRTVHRLALWLTSGQFDGAVAWMSKGYLYLGPAAIMASKRSAWFQHGVASRASLDHLATALPSAEVWCCSRAAASAQRALWPTRRTRVLYPGIDLRRFDPDRVPSIPEARRRVALEPHAPVIIMAARLQRLKGCDLFLEAASLVRQEFPQAHFILVGGEHFSEPGYRTELEQKAETAGLGCYFRLLGHRYDIADVMQAADIVVNASVTEALGMTILEGMALRKPVVVRRNSLGPEEIVVDHLTGRLFDGGPSGLARVLTDLLRDADERARLAGAGHALVTRNFGAGTFAVTVTEACKQLFATSRTDGQ